MAKIIVVTLRKGGSGKTTTAVNLAAALHQRKKKVLLIDLDAQANATLSVGVDPMGLERSINTLFTDSYSTPKDVILKTGFGLSLLPSHTDLANTEAGMKATQIGILRGLVAPIKNDYDFIIIDAPPSESFLTVNALTVAHEVVIPFQTHLLAMRGLKDAQGEIEQVRQGLNPKIQIAGILPTMFNPRTNVSRSMLEEVRTQYGQSVYPFQVEFSIRHVEA